MSVSELMSHAVAISLADVWLRDRDRYNSNNHWINKVPPADYKSVLQRGHTRHWIERFHGSTFQRFDIPAKEMSWMRRASAIGHMTGAFPRGYVDELLACVEAMSDVHIQHFTSARAYFVRTESVSLKHGVHGAGPYHTLREILESLCTSREGHNPIDDIDLETGTLTIYLLPWIADLDPFREVRVFVYQGRITAISQQRVYEVNGWVSGDADETMARYGDAVVRFINQEVLPRIMDISTGSCCIDLGCRQDGQFYFIEPNSFGKEYAAGSALFHWLIDEDILYGRATDSVPFRYVVE